ncbi:MAG: TonB family protein [Candidatus Kapaibacterium sp.]|nr:MAG: TonB family protein [Candidatus Kapabacteria bacterium]
MESDIAAYRSLEPSADTSAEDVPVKVRSLARVRLERELQGMYNAERRRNHTIAGSVLAMSVLLLLLLGLSVIDITPYVRREERITIPIQLLEYGVVGSSEANKGNLSAEGTATKAPASAQSLADAVKAKTQVQAAQNQTAQTQTTTKTPPQTTPIPATPPKTLASASTTAKPREYTQPSFTKPVQEERSAKAEKANDEKPNTSKQEPSKQEPAKQEPAQKQESTTLASNSTPQKTSVGTQQGSTSPDAEGLGRFGSGAGRGQGYGLEWGGGGNRVVLHKELPKYPPGMNTSTQIKIRFTVNPNGTVGMILPMQKGDPLLERAAIEALRRWQFNPLQETKEMVGFITFTFRVQ